MANYTMNNVYFGALSPGNHSFTLDRRYYRVFLAVASGEAYIANTASALDTTELIFAPAGTTMELPWLMIDQLHLRVTKAGNVQIIAYNE